MENVDIEAQVAEAFEAQDPNLEVFENETNHYDTVVAGVESIIRQYRQNGKVEIGGCEAYAIGMLKANGMQWDIHRGYENFVTDGAKKLYEMILAMLKRIKEYLFGGGESGDQLSLADDADAIKAKEDALKKADSPRNAADAINTGAVLNGADSLAVALTTPAPSVPAVIRNTNEERNLTIIEARRSLTPEAQEVRALLVKHGHTSPSDQQKIIRQAITSKAADPVVEQAFTAQETVYQMEKNIERGDTVAANALKSVKSKLDAYIAFFNSKKEDLPHNFGDWTGFWSIQNNIDKKLTGHAMAYLLELCKDGNDLERAISRDTKQLENVKEKLKSHSEEGILAGIMADIALMQQVVSREANVAAEIKASQRKIKKAFNRQVSAIEKARAQLVIRCVKAHLKEA